MTLIEVAQERWGNAPGIAVARAMADAVDELTCALVEGYQASEGPAPEPFAWMALGSHARGELHCASDQDHALVWTTPEVAASEYSRGMADHVIAGLNEFGMRPCSGGYMADKWTMSLADWASTLHDRINSPTADAIVDADIFLDLRRVTGDLDTSALQAVLASGGNSARLLHGLAGAANSFPVPLSPLGRLPKDIIDVKRTGIAPIVLLARVYALQAGSAQLATIARLRDANTAGLLSEQLTRRLIFAYTLLTRLRLGHQLEQIESDEPITDLIEVESIPWNDQKLLRKAFKSVKSAQTATALTFRTDL